jgi:flagella basal body P-ring formation protein FlgA
MATTLRPATGSSNGSGSQRAGIEPVRRRQRSIPAAVGAAVCMVAAVVVFVGLQLAGSDRQAVLAIARPVAAGATLTAGDLAVAEVIPDAALHPVPLALKDSVIGRTAKTDLLPGSLLTTASLGEKAPLAAGEALVGVDVASAAAPVGAIAAGDRVQVIGVDKTGDGNSSNGQVLAAGQVVRVDASQSSSGSTTSVSLIVPAADAGAVAAASVSQQVALVVIR